MSTPIIEFIKKINYKGKSSKVDKLMIEKINKIVNWINIQENFKDKT